MLEPRFMLSLLKVEGRSIVEQVSTTQMYLVQQTNDMVKGKDKGYKDCDVMNMPHF